MSLSLLLIYLFPSLFFGIWGIVLLELCLSKADVYSHYLGSLPITARVSLAMSSRIESCNLQNYERLQTILMKGTLAQWFDKSNPSSYDYIPHSYFLHYAYHSRQNLRIISKLWHILHLTEVNIHIFLYAFCMTGKLNYVIGVSKQNNFLNQISVC